MCILRAFFQFGTLKSVYYYFCSELYHTPNFCKIQSPLWESLELSGTLSSGLVGAQVQ